MSEEKPKPIKIEKPEDATLTKGPYYCRFFDRWNNETACSGGIGSEDECANLAHEAGAYAYAWTMKPC
jgi:hypothetical protein